MLLIVNHHLLPFCGCSVSRTVHFVKLCTQKSLHISWLCWASCSTHTLWQAFYVAIWWGIISTHFVRRHSWRFLTFLEMWCTNRNVCIIYGLWSKVLDQSWTCDVMWCEVKWKGREEQYICTTNHPPHKAPWHCLLCPPPFIVCTNYQVGFWDSFNVSLIRIQKWYQSRCLC